MKPRLLISASLSGIVATALLSGIMVLAGGCTKQPEQGGLELRITEPSTITDATKSRISEFTALPDKKDYDIEITNSIEQTVWSGKLGDWDETRPLAGGTYRISASYGTEGEEGMQKPRFKGETEFTIEGKGTKRVSIPVQLKNCVVRLSFSESFSKYFKDYDILVTSGAGNSFRFTPTKITAATSAAGVTTAAAATKADEGRFAVFLEAYRITVSGTLTNQGGSTMTISPKQYDGLREATCYTLLFDAAGIGGTSLYISFDNKTDVVTIDGPELN